MINLILMSYLMFFLVLMFLMSMFYFYIFNYQLIFEWMIYFNNSEKFSFLLYFDYITLMFLMVVSLISLVVFLYSIEYMSGEYFLSRFSYLLILFIFSMFFMILSPSILTILLGWDGLGLISYCLIIFYQNKNAFNAGMLTIFSNRIGDVGILLLICLSLSFGSWNLMNYFLDGKMVMLLILISFTKSAQIPFTLWLPAAMMAPTPVSSLVHSSTLVTAGIYLMIRFNKFLFINNLNEYILFISSMTMFMAGLIANFEYDFKKIIALSTLSQLGLMMSILSLGLWELAFFHLIIHALFKSLMFLCVGSFIHLNNNSQDIREYGGLIYCYPFKIMVLIMSLLCLMGFPFLSGYFSKDLIMEFFFIGKLNFISFSFLMFATIFTVSYSVRLIMFIIFSKSNGGMILFKKESILMNLCMSFLMIMIINIGYLFMKLNYWNFILVLTINQKLFILKLILYGLLLGLLFFFYINKFNFIGFYLNNMFLVNKIYQLYNIPLNFMNSYDNLVEKNLIDFGMKIYKFKFLFKYYMMEEDLKYFMMMLMNILIFFILIMYFK